MTPQLITSVIPFTAKAGLVEAELAKSWGNPVRPEAAERLDAIGTIHFMGIHAIPVDAMPGAEHVLVVELAVDGSPTNTIEQLADRFDRELRALFKCANLPDEPPAGVLMRYQRKLGLGWFGAQGLGFCGTPGFSVRRIRREFELAQQVGRMIVDADRHASAAQKLERIRAQLWQSGWRWAFEPEACLDTRVGEVSTALAKSLWPLFRTLLWPLAILPLLAAGTGFWLGGLGLASVLAGAAALGEAAWGYALYRRFRDQEATDLVDAEPAPAKRLAEIVALEDRTAQNHVLVRSRLKDGWLRRFSLRLGLFAIRQALLHVYPPGKLGDIATIHVARWIVLPESSQLLFLSNYGGSWDSYLEDFIIKAHQGLTGSWSNTKGFPRSSNLFSEGAVHGAEFKVWARRQQLPTRCWYSAYPSLTTSRIRINSEIRRGLCTPQTGAEAAGWLALFGASNPANLELAQIPALVFGGLPRLGFGTALLGKFSDGPSAKRWLQRVERHVAYGEEPTRKRVLQVAFTARGLRTLGVDEGAIETFPVPFKHGSRLRAHKLGDREPERWNWSDAEDNGVDALTLVYADSSDELQKFVAEVQGDAFAHCVTVPFQPRPTDQPARELFGFVDGISQPALRGTRKATRTTADHVLQPGELILGYPDESGFIAPCPLRELGRNGTFLVVRQLEQDRAGFDRFLDASADTAEVRAALPQGEPALRRDWVAAKLMGRWRNGNSLVRNPHAPGKAGSDDNAFRYAEDPSGVRCPYGAHVRRANPRDSFGTDAAEQLRVVNRHRILRVGRNYTVDNQARGMLFMCLNADIERQFEFVQQSWLLAPSFHGLPNEVDPILAGAEPGKSKCLTVPTESGPLRINGIDAFVNVLGSGYFFMPGRACMNFLAAAEHAVAAE